MLLIQKHLQPNAKKLRCKVKIKTKIVSTFRTRTRIIVLYKLVRESEYNFDNSRKKSDSLAGKFLTRNFEFFTKKTCQIKLFL